MNRTVPPPLVERVVEGADYAVEVTWRADAVLPRILAALGSTGYLLAQAARYRQALSPEARAEALARIANHLQVQDAFTFRLAPEHAEALATALELNAAEPDRCSREGCDLLEVDASGFCPGHLDDLDRIPRAAS